MEKKIIIICSIAIATVLVILTGMGIFLYGIYDEHFKLITPSDFDEEWIIGKNSTEIIKKYGEFDIHPREIQDGSYYSVACGYSYKKIKHVIRDVIFDLQPYSADEKIEYCMIYFDENGIAYQVNKNWLSPGI